MASPTLIASYAVYSAGVDTSALTTPSFTPSNGEVIVVKLATWDASNPMGAVSGGGQTYTTRVTGPTSGFNGWVRVVTAVISGSPGSMTITAAGTATNSRHSMVVERWSGQLAGSPAVNSTTFGSGAPSANITTAAAGSAVSWVSVDVASQDPATKAYRLSGTEDGLFDGHVGSNSVHYFAYAGSGTGVGAAGTYAMGLSAPGSQTWVLAGIEIQGSAGQTAAAGTTTETDSAISLARTKTRTVGTTAETDAAQAVARSKSKTVSLAGETDAAVALTRAKARMVGIASETAAAQALAKSKTRAIGLITETDAAQPITRAKTLALGITATTETAQPIGRRKTRAVGTPVEADTAVAIAGGVAPTTPQPGVVTISAAAVGMAVSASHTAMTVEAA